MPIKIQQLFWISLCSLLFPLVAAAAEPVHLMSMRIQPSHNATQFIFVLSKKTSGTVKYQSNPDRVILEFSSTDKRFNIQNAKLVGANVETINSEEMPNGTLRFVFTTKGKVKWKTRYLPNGNENNVLFQLDIISTKSTSLLDNTITIAIDAGHGGKDSGARGVTGVEEKDVVLNIAKKISAELNKMPNLRAILTRSGDYYVPLRERLKLARKDKADLFVAIHADAYFNTSATGMSVYALSQHGATSEAARWLAQRENYSELGGIELDALPDRSPMVRSVLIDLAQTATIRDSIRLGNNVLDALDSVSSLHYTHVEQAPFMVLKSPDIPSILVEMGFISNPIEEKLLSDDEYQDQLAHALCLGIQEYVMKYGLQKE